MVARIFQQLHQTKAAHPRMPQEAHEVLLFKEFPSVAPQTLKKVAFVHRVLLLVKSV